MPVLVFGHHHVWPIDAPTRPDDYFGIRPSDSEALVGGRRPAGEHRRATSPGTPTATASGVTPARATCPSSRSVCTKDYPGAWAEYRVYEGGYTQVVRRVAAPAAFDWAEETSVQYLGLYRELARGNLAERCFTQRF